MKLKLVTLLTLSLIFLGACGAKEKTEAIISPTSTDEQKFSYMLGVQFARQAFKVVPHQTGQELQEDYTIQGAFDAALGSNDSTISLQLPRDALMSVSKRYSLIAKERTEKALPDSATLATVNPGAARHISEALLSALPIIKASPATGKLVKVSNTSSDIEKFSYMLGAEFGTQFSSIGAQLETDLSAVHFKVGLQDGAHQLRDSTYVAQLPEDSLRAVGRRFSEKGNALQQKAQKQAMEEQAKLKEKIGGLVGDTLADGTPAKINFTLKVSALNSKIESLAPYAKKPLFIFYYSTTCGHCYSVAPKIDEFAAKFKPDGLTTLAITSGGNYKKSIRSFSDDLKIKNMEILLDEERMFGELYGDGYVPKFYLVRPDGTYKRYPSFEKDLSEIEADVKALLKK